MEVLRRRAAFAAGPVVTGGAAAKAERPLPPLVPEELSEVDEALKLLGNHIQALQAGTKLRESVRMRLQELIGVVPALAEAKSWKSGLKELRGELAQLEKRVEPPSLGPRPVG